MLNLKARLLPAIEAVNDPAHGGKNYCQTCDKTLKMMTRVFFNPTGFVFCSEECTVRHAKEVVHLNYVIMSEMEAEKRAS
jgi:hypothetical protein